MKQYLKYALWFTCFLCASITLGQNDLNQEIRRLYELSNKDYAYGRNQEALESYRQLETLGYENSSELDQDEKDAINRGMSWAYRELGYYTEAIPYIIKDLVILEKKGESKNNSYLFGQANLAEAIYFSVGNFPEAEALYEKTLKNSKMYLTPTYYNEVLTQAIEFYSEINKYANALELQPQQLGILERRFGKNDRQYYKYLSIYGVNNVHNGNYDLAEQILDEVLFLIKKNEGSNTDNYANNLHNLAIVKSNKGELYSGIKLNFEALKIFNQTQGKESEDYISVLNSIAILYYELGDFDQAKVDLEEAYNLGVITLGKENYANFTPLFNLASIYFGYRDLNKTRYYLSLAKNIEELHRSSEYSKDLAAVLSLDVKLLLAEENYLDAQPKALKHREIITALTGKKSSNFASSTNNLAHIYFQVNRKKEAMQLFEEAFGILRINEGDQSENYATLANIISLNHQSLGNNEKAIQYAQFSNSSRLNSLSDVFQFRSEYDKNLYLESFIVEADQYASFAKSIDDRSGKIAILNTNNELVKKGLLLNSSLDVLKNLSALNDEEINTKIKSYREERSKLNKAIIKSNQKLIDSLYPITERLETDLVRTNAAQSNKINFVDKRWEEVKNRLKYDEIAIEFSRYNHSTKEALTDSIYYAAYIISKQYEHPKVIQLFEETILKEIIKNKSPNALYFSRGSILKSKQNTLPSIELYNLIFGALEESIESINRIFYAPSGLITQIPLEALYLSQNKNKSTQLIQLSTTYNLCDDVKEPTYDRLLFVGGVDYNTSTNAAIAPLTKKKSIETWKYLPGTLREIDTLKSLFPQENVTILSGSNATEGAFKELSGRSPNILHIATHGYFFNQSSSAIDSNDPEYNIFKNGSDPLLRSGLILANGNKSWNDETTISEEEDGILTALEISNLDLSSTDIVILSACETGLGDIEGSEGVYGLQRAFKMAGVNIIVMSLWEVPDKETAEFMKLFYKTWVETGRVREAFRSTQREMASKYRDDPEKWAAFVMIE
ncbi:CHAT domain-containing protein [Dokdonia sp. Asnod1-B02]|uniref:CHAT domain-containing protein n=1 Tax=Dokdonia sp. Asnod1-B02 TaxID=3160573 RepID=UPI003870486F